MRTTILIENEHQKEQQARRGQKRAGHYLKLSFALSMLCLLLLPLGLTAQVVKPFTQRTSKYTPTQPIYHIQGDFQVIGNTNLTLSSYRDDRNNSNNNMKYVDIDGVSSTINSSSAQLKFSTERGANPECTNVLYAGLYWTGRNNTGNLNSTIGGTSGNYSNSVQPQPERTISDNYNHNTTSMAIP